jgi:hypothetical protein
MVGHGEWWRVVAKMREKWKWAFSLFKGSVCVFFGIKLTTHQKRELKPNEA